MDVLQQSQVANLLLRYCGAEDFDRLAPHLRRVHLETRASIFERNEPIDRIYFPEGGVASIVAEQERGEQVEIGLFGVDGMSGTAVVLGAGQTPQASMIQINGSPGLVIDTERFLEACEASPSLLRQMLRYVQAMNVQAAATAGANAFPATSWN